MHRLLTKTNRTLVIMSVFTAFLICSFFPQHLLAACSPPAGYGSVTSTITVADAGTYRVWSRVKVPDTSNNSYLLEIDNGTCYTVGDGGISANTWTWVDFMSGNNASHIDVDLESGNHTVKLYGNAANVQLDRLILIRDAGCIPSEKGDNCVNSSSSSPISGTGGSTSGDGNGSGSGGSGAGADGGSQQNSQSSQASDGGGILDKFSPAAVSKSVQNIAAAAKKNPVTASAVGIAVLAAASGLGYLAYTYKPWRLISSRIKSSAPSVPSVGLSPSDNAHEPVMIHPEKK